MDLEGWTLGIAAGGSAFASAPLILAALRPAEPAGDLVLVVSWPASVVLALAAAGLALRDWGAARQAGRKPSGRTLAALAVVGVTLLADLVPFALLPFVLR